MLNLRHVLTQNEIPSFRSLVPNRHASPEDYRYGSQNQEKDDEIKGEGGVRKTKLYEAVKEGYKEYDKIRTNGGESEVTK